MRLEYWGVMILSSWSTVWALGFGLRVSSEALGRRRGRRQIMCRRLGSGLQTPRRPAAGPRVTIYQEARSGMQSAGASCRPIDKEWARQGTGERERARPHPK